MTPFLQRLWALLGPMPSTNVRIFVTLAIVILTALRYFASGFQFFAYTVATWIPTPEWLLFLAGMSGIDVAQFAVKRKTHDESKGKKEAGDAA